MVGSLCEIVRWICLPKDFMLEGLYADFVDAMHDGCGRSLLYATGNVLCGACAYYSVMVMLNTLILNIFFIMDIIKRHHQCFHLCFDRQCCPLKWLIKQICIHVIH